LKRGSVIEVVQPETLKLRQTIVIGPGEKIPVDALVTSGKSMVDTKALTGEAEPVEVKIGYKIFSGCINLSGVIEAKVLKRYKESTAVKILEMVEHVEEKKPDQERGMEFFMRYYTPGVIVISVLIMLLPPLFFPDQDTHLWLVRSLTFLIAACPCGLLASIPLAYLGGVGAALRQGILVKGAVYLERLARAETFLFDKTGTLTEGIFKVKKIVSRKIPGRELLRIATYGEAFSNHPIAVSLRRAYGRRINTKKVTNMTEESGFGVSGKVDGKDVIIGSNRYLSEFGIFSRSVTDIGTAVHVAIDGEYAGYILLADHPREEVDRLIRWLQRRKHEVVILSGDNERVVNDIGQQLGIKTTFSNLMPEDKMDYLNIYLESQLGEGKVVFVGDGLNDALVLAAADVGIGMGGLGADAALEAADIVLLEDEPVKIINAIRIAKSVSRAIRYNLMLVVLVKILLLGLAVTGLITMGRAVLVDVGVMFILMLNAFWLVKHPERNK
jgi:Cd2+/Zn2+-exporting ATPase